MGAQGGDVARRGLACRGGAGFVLVWRGETRRRDLRDVVCGVVWQLGCEEFALLGQEVDPQLSYQVELENKVNKQNLARSV